MLELSERLSAGFPHVRVDWYNIGGKPYFGEMTFYTGGGYDPFYALEEQPDELDRELGELFVLPEGSGSNINSVLSRQIGISFSGDNDA